MNNRLTKAQIIAGAKVRKTVPIEGLGDVEIRPLTDEEWSEVEMTTLKSLNVDINKGASEEEVKSEAVKNLSLDDLAAGQLEAARLIVKYGLSTDEEWTVDEVRELPAGIAHALAREVNKLTGAETTYADLVPFREKSRGNRHRSSAGNGASSGGDTKGADTPTA